VTATAKKNTRPSIAELKQKIGAEQNALDDLQARAAELQEARKAALLADGDEQLTAVEESIQTTLRRAERHRARLDAALAELEAAEEEQRQEEALADYQRAAAELKQAEDLLMVDYPRAAADLAGILARVQAADRLAERVNSELPAGCEPLRPPSHARHESATDDRVELREVRRWVNKDGHQIGAIQFLEGKPPAGARQVLVQEEVRIPGRKPWWPSPIYADVRLPALHKDAPDFWWP
jgi:vacuolar-type H+-ATPase subunit I/STV1